MSGGEDVNKGRRFFSFTASMVLVMSTLLIGITLEVPNASAGAVTLNAGELQINILTDFGRIFLPLQWPANGTMHTVSNSGFGYMGLVVDQQNYDHTPGSTDIADCYTLAAINYMSVDDFSTIKPSELIIDTPAMDKMIASFQNTGTTQDPNDILINLTAWSVQNKDWAILQWHVNNIKSPSADILNLKIGFEVDISQEGGTYGLGGDAGDDIDGFDAAEDVYWAVDNGGAGVCLGFASAIVSDPINHYYSEDYHPATYDDYKTMWEDEDWLYGRISAPNSVGGATPGNRTSTVGWNGFTIPAGGSRTFTMVIAMNSTYYEMITAIKDAQWYYRNVLTGFLMTEFTDSGGSHQIEIFNNGREPTSASDFSFTSNSGALTGSWSQDPIPTYEYSYLTITGGSIDDKGDIISFYENAALVEQISFGQEGIAPDPTPTMSVGRYFDPSTATYTDDWTHHLVSGDTFGSQNDAGYTVVFPWIIINRVMYNPSVSAEGYVELMYRGFSPTGIDISNYMVIANDGYAIPGPITLNVTNKFYVFCQSDMAAFFSNIDINGDNVYLYAASGNLLDMVGWNDPHTQGYFMSRTPDGNGTFQGYDDATSVAAGWVFDQQPIVMLTEFYADGTSAQIEIYNPRGGEIVLDGRWSVQSSTGPLNLAPNSGTIPRNGGYDYFTDTGGNAPGVEGDTFTLLYDPGSGQITMDLIGYGTHGIAPDPLSTESTSRYWDDYILGYNDDWTRDTTTSFGSQNVVPAVNKSSFVILNEVMFNTPDTGKYFVIINRMPGWYINISGFIMVSDQEYVLPDFSITPGGFNGTLFPPGEPQNSVIIKFMDDTPNSDLFFQSMNDNAPVGDNVYFYDPNGRLLDMVGWDTQHTQGMSVRRVPDGNGTHQGYDDVSSETASWVFDHPLAVQITEISDDQGSSQIEIYNPIYSPIHFDNPGYTFQNSTGAALTGTWTDPDANAGEYALFDLSAPGLSHEGDSIHFYQNGILIEDISYGQKGTVPDPLPSESVQRYWDGTGYTNVWERNLTTGPNFGIQNDVPPANFSSVILLNEILFNPYTPVDHFVELYLLHGSVNISGYRIVCDSDFIIPMGIELNETNRFFNFTYSMDPTFFNNLDRSGDNVYLYDDNGSLLDMAGWSSLHQQGWSMRRVPDGNGTRDGFDDTSSIAAGWIFGNETEPPPLPPSPPKDLIAVLINDAKDVLLSWNASSDDGAGDNDIAGYTVYRSSTGVKGNYDFEAWIPANGSSSYSWIDINAGDGDWNNYFYIVRANDTLDLEEQNTNKAGKFTNYLVKNWNLMSVPLIQTNTSMEYVLQTIEGNYTIVQGYHAGKSRPWLHYHKNKPKYFNDEIEINHKEGYYIKMKNSDYLIVAGRVPVDTHIPLKTGWNLVGYPCLINKTRDDALSSIAGKYNMVEYYDPDKCKEVRLGPDDFMQPGLGYWIHATDDCVLIL